MKTLNLTWYLIACNEIFMENIPLLKESMVDYNGQKYMSLRKSIVFQFGYLENYF